MTKQKLTIKNLITCAKVFCEQESKTPNSELFGVTDGKAVGTHIEHKFKDLLRSKYDLQVGSSASGIDLPSVEINTDIKVTSIRQPQSSCPFKNAQQKIFGLGYNLLVFVYDKQDDAKAKTALLNFVSCCFVIILPISNMLHYIVQFVFRRFFTILLDLVFKPFFYVFFLCHTKLFYLG